MKWLRFPVSRLRIVEGPVCYSTKMKFGIVTPVVTLSQRSHAEWERGAGPVEIRQIATAADRLGYEYLTCSEHVAIPESALASRGGRYYDPAATLGYVAAVTQRIRLLTHVIVLPYHHPLTLAKRYGTLDTLSGGRLTFGVGVGSLEEEFNLLGVPFDDRGPRFEDALRALRAAFGKETPEYSGSHFTFSGFRIDPHSLQRCPPIWLGGRSPRSLRRALEFGDGWNPFLLSPEELRQILGRARRSAAWEKRHAATADFELALTPERPFALESEGDFEAARSIVRTYRSIGATALNIRLAHRSADHYVDLLGRFAEFVMPEFS